MAAILYIPESEIRKHGPGNALVLCWRQWRAERRLARRGVHFRDDDLEKTAAAYASMSSEEFDAVNGRQAWANWRTIPRALSGNVENRPLRILDLGCGAGSSTQALAFYCPEGSHITGYEVVAPLVDLARRRAYHHRHGASAKVDFVCQGVTETFRETDGSIVADQGVDLINASGIVGHHLNETTIQPLIAEISRVLAPQGVALLDVGPTLPEAALKQIMSAAGFVSGSRHRSWWGDPTGEVVFRRRTTSTGSASVPK